MGIPENSGTFNFTVQAKNDYGTDLRDFRIVIYNPNPTPEPDNNNNNNQNDNNNNENNNSNDNPDNSNNNSSGGGGGGGCNSGNMIFNAVLAMYFFITRKK